MKFTNVSLFRVAPVLLIFLFAIGCDSSDPDDDLPADEIAGTYRFERLTFVPDATALDSADVLVDTLITASTTLEFLNGGQYSLRYQLLGGTNRIISGSFNLSTELVELEASETAGAELRNILLDSPLRLERGLDDSTLEGTIRKTANLEAYNPSRYAGFEEVPGTLYVVMRKVQ